MMADLIDRKKIKAKFEPWLKVQGYSEGELNMLKAVLYEITVMPSAQPERCEDCVNFSKTRLLIPQSEIIRCKDCKHSYETFAGLICSHGVCVDCVVRDDFYCSYGERKDE